MKSILKMGCAALLAGGMQATLHAQTPEVSTQTGPATLTLSQCIERAIAVAPAIQAALSDQQAVEAKLGQAKAAYIVPEFKLRVLGGPVPDVPSGLGPPNFPTYDRDFTEWGPFVQARVEAIQPIYTFGKLSSA